MKSPQQQIYDAVFKASLELGYKTLDYLPPHGESYPFVFVGEQFDQDRRTKLFIFGDVQQTVHIYHDYKKRRELTDMMNELKRKMREIKRTENFYVDCTGIESQTLIDSDGTRTLLHGILEFEFTFH